MSSRTAPRSYPSIEIQNHDGTAPVTVMVWHIRAIYSAKVRGPKIGTRIEFSNGDTLDSAETVGTVLSLFHEAVEGPKRGYPVE